MNIQTSYQFIMEEQDLDTGDVYCTVSRRITKENLQALTEAFRHFLWNIGFIYVENVVVEENDREGNITETRA